MASDSPPEGIAAAAAAAGADGAAGAGSGADGAGAAGAATSAAGGGGGHVHMCVFGDDDWYACLDGHLETVRSPEHAERFWSSVTEAWYPQGKNDPELIMLKFTPMTGEIWASTSSTLKFGWEIAKANLTDSEPDVGYKTAVNFRAA